jgi:hypothetical protein
MNATFAAAVSKLSSRAAELVVDLSLAKPTVEGHDAAIAKAYHAALEEGGEDAARSLMAEVSSFGYRLPLSLETMNLIAVFRDVESTLEAAARKGGYVPPKPTSNVPGDWLGR